MSVTLFHRIPSGLQPTEQGSMLEQHVARGFASIRNGRDRITRRPGTVRVTLLPMFACRWLSTRLGLLLEAHPGMNLPIQNHNNSNLQMPNPEHLADLGIQ